MTGRWAFAGDFLYLTVCTAVVVTVGWLLIEGVVRAASLWDDWRQRCADRAAVAALYARYTEEAQR